MIKHIFPNGDKLEMKAIQRVAFASEETHCYQAKLYLNGKHIATVRNDGHGGADDQYPEGDFTDSDLKALSDRCEAEMPKYVSKYVPEGLEVDLEMWCQGAVDDYLLLQTMKKDMRAKVLAYDPADPKTLSQITFKGVRKLTDRHLHVAADRYRDLIFLNMLPVDQAFAIYKEAH